MRKVCVYSVCMADVQNPLTVPAILVSGQARCRCRRQNTGRTDRTLCRGVCGRFSGRYYEPVRKSLSKIKKRRLFGVIVLQDMGYFSSFLTDIMQIILNGMLFLLQFRVFVNLFPDEHQREAYKKQKTGYPDCLHAK